MVEMQEFHLVQVEEMASDFLAIVQEAGVLEVMAVPKRWVALL